MRKVIFISSTGGHLTELLKLEPLFNKFDYLLITEKTSANLNLKKKYNTKFLVFGSKDHIFSYIFKFLYNIIKSFVIFIKFKPEFIITTGTHTAVPMCYIAHIFKKKVIFIETFANTKTKTLAGKMVYPISDLFIVQWESMLEQYENAVYGGWIF